MSLKQPIGQKRLTNVAVVRLRRCGLCFEVACYKNKVLNWRAGIEKDLDEVLQTTTVFSNVSKGVLAKEKDLKITFGTTDEKQICLEILQIGELQVSQKERKLEYENMFKDVATIIAEKCVDPVTNRPYTISLIERALRDVHFNIDLKKSAKQQAFTEALPMLQERFSIQRANMRVRFIIPLSASQALEKELLQEGIKVESHNTDISSGASFVCLISPGVYRKMHTIIEMVSPGKGLLEVVNLAVAGEGISMMKQESDNISETKSNDKETAEKEELKKSTSVEEVKESLNEESGAVEIYKRGLIPGIPDDFSRKQMFMEIDELQKGWEVALTTRRGSDVISAVFYSPDGKEVGAFVKARKMALMASKSI